MENLENIDGRNRADPPFVAARSPSAEAEARLRDEGGEQHVSDDASAEWEGRAHYAPACGSTSQAGGAHTRLHALSHAHTMAKPARNSQRTGTLGPRLLHRHRPSWSRTNPSLRMPLV